MEWDEGPETSEGFYFHCSYVFPSKTENMASVEECSAAWVRSTDCFSILISIFIQYPLLSYLLSVSPALLSSLNQLYFAVNAVLKHNKVFFWWCLCWARKILPLRNMATVCAFFLQYSFVNSLSNKSSATSHCHVAKFSIIQRTLGRGARRH